MRVNEFVFDYGFGPGTRFYVCNYVLSKNSNQAYINKEPTLVELTNEKWNQVREVNALTNIAQGCTVDSTYHAFLTYQECLDKYEELVTIAVSKRELKIQQLIRLNIKLLQRLEKLKKG